ncbi:MAG TPA: dienelactone hydrolase family protein [Roseiarcus sp.]|jgi:phospholipase/carboxylesterase
MTVKLTGPRRDPRGAATKQLVVFLHGYGADGEDLIALGDQWRGLLPNASFVSPHAPERCSGSPTGRQWFALSTTEPEDPRGADERWKGVVSAQPSIDAFLDEELARLGLDESRLALVGFSQGAMMALHVGLRRKRAPAAIIGYSGLLVGPDHLGEAGAARGEHAPILLVHGDQDPVIPLEAMFIAMNDLAKAEIPSQWHLSFGIGHGIDGGGLRHGGLFLAQAFGVRAR